MMVGHDTGCITTLDKNQWIGAAAGKPVDLPVLADCQFAALVCGAHPYKIVQSHWHASSTESLMEKLGIDWEKKKAEFEAYLKDVEAGKGETLYDPRLMITSGPGFKPQEQLKMSKPVLIIGGGGPAGLAAAHSLATVGKQSIIVEKEDQARRRADTVRLREARAYGRVGQRCDRRHGDARRNGKRTSPSLQATTVTEFDGDSRQFSSAAFERRQRIEADAAILCSGFTHFDSVNKPEWGFGTFPDVVTTTQVEQMISSGDGVRCPSDGRKPKRVAILLCVGSRDRQIGREWCSKICCTVSSNLAMEIREELPDCHVYIYYMDIRTFGLYETKYYWRSQEEFKVKYIKARIAEVTSDGEKLIVKGEDTLVKRPITIPFDMVVHAIGMDPNVDNPDIANISASTWRRTVISTRPIATAQWARRRALAFTLPARQRGRRPSTTRSPRDTLRRWPCSRASRLL